VADGTSAHFPKGKGTVAASAPAICRGSEGQPEACRPPPVPVHPLTRCRAVHLRSFATQLLAPGFIAQPVPILDGAMGTKTAGST